MNQSLTLAQADAPLCPTWCVDHVPNGCYGAEHTYTDTFDGHQQDLIVRLARIAEPGEPEVLFVDVATRQPGSAFWSEFDPDRPLSPAGAAWLGWQLSEVAAAAIGTRPVSEPPQILPGPLNKYGRGVNTLVCVDCGSEFFIDSSPHLDRCNACAERADAEAGR